MGTYLVVLISCDSNKISLGENICPESAVRELQNIVGSHNMEPGLVFMHWIQDGLIRRRGWEVLVLVTTIIRFK